MERRADVRAAVAFVHAHDEATLDTQIALSEIPAPAFREDRRGARLAQLFTSCGLEAVRRDAAGNVIAERPGAAGGGPLVIGAHLDTVFAEGTDVSVRREGATLRGPGISDDARGLATMLTLVRALQASRIRTVTPLLFVGTVGEEGIGDLRGVRALFADSGAARDAAGFISLDGAGIDRIVAHGLGSRRYRITISGPGGHSWTDWGAPNPAHALVSLGSVIRGVPLDTEPPTTLTIARLKAGTSINSIPQAAWMEIDTRSSDTSALDRLEAELRSVIDGVRRVEGDLDYQLDVIGDRPGGHTSVDDPLVVAALAATRLVGHRPKIARSSTDANVPMALGIGAVTLGCGGEAGSAHTTNEWYRNVEGPEGIVRALYTVLLAAGLEGEGRG